MSSGRCPLAECSWADFGCHIGKVATDAIEGASKGAFENAATLVVEGMGVAIASLGTMWTSIPSNALSLGTAGNIQTPPSEVQAPVLVVMNYVTWIGLVVAGISIVILGAMMTFKVRRGEAFLALGKLGAVLGGVTVIGASPGIVNLVLRAAGNVQIDSTVQMLQNSLLWVTAAISVIAIVTAGARMAWQMRAEPGKEVMQGLIKLIIVAGGGLTIVQMLMWAGDAFSVWILRIATSCDDTVTGGSCFGKSLSQLLWGLLTLDGLGIFLILLFGSIAVLFSMTQVMLMIGRNGVVLILAGILPAAAATAMAGPSQKQWWEKTVAWLIAWVLYKPAAAVVYAVAFLLTGNGFDGGDALMATLTGIMMMLVSLIALPALMKLVTPGVTALAAGASGGGGFGGAMLGSLVASGAQMLSGGGGGSATGASGSSSGSSSPSFADSTPSGSGGQPGGASQGGGAGQGAGSSSETQGAKENASAEEKSATPNETSESGAQGGQKATGARDAGTGQNAGSAAGASGAGTESGGASAAGAGAGGAAAAGPIGAGVAAAGAVVQAGESAARKAGDDMTGEPSGSR